MWKSCKTLKPIPHPRYRLTYWSRFLLGLQMIVLWYFNSGRLFPPIPTCGRDNAKWQADSNRLQTSITAQKIKTAPYFKLYFLIAPAHVSWRHIGAGMFWRLILTRYRETTRIHQVKTSRTAPDASREGTLYILRIYIHIYYEDFINRWTVSMFHLHHVINPPPRQTSVSIPPLLLRSWCD